MHSRMCVQLMLSGILLLSAAGGMDADEYRSGTLPRVKADRGWLEVEALPQQLRELFAVPASWLAQLTSIKIYILVLAFIKVAPGFANSKEQVAILVRLIQGVIKVRSNGLSSGHIATGTCNMSGCRDGSAGCSLYLLPVLVVVIHHVSPLT